MKQIDNISIKDYLYEEIKNMIDNESLPTGKKIDRVELANKFGVSMTPINDALNRLAGEKYIIQEPRKGFFVKEMSLEELSQLFEVRTAIESMAIRLCCERAKDSEIKEMSDYFKDFELPFSTSEYKRYVQTDKKFHNLLIKYSGNQYFSQILNNTGFQLKSNLKGLVRPPEETLTEHRQIVSYLKKRDSENASKALASHLFKSREKLLAIINAK